MNRRRLSLLLLVLPLAVLAGDVRFEWDHITDQSLAAYRLYHGPAPRTYTNSVLITGTNTGTLSLPMGTNYVAVTAVYFGGVAGIESDYSEELKIFASPPCPKNLRLLE